MENIAENNHLKQNPIRILITGGTGFIGEALLQEFIKDQHKITILTRNNQFKNNSLISYIFDLDLVDFNFDVVINLAGSTIATNWNNQNKKDIYDSRINITKKIVEKINSSQNPPQLFISGSAIGVYGSNSNSKITESEIIKLKENNSTNSNSFLEQNSQENFSQKLCYDWENIALQVQGKTRVVLLRTGIVLGRKNNQLAGFLQKIYWPFFLGAGAKIGDGKQQMSWIAIEDVIGIIKLIIDDKNIVNAINLTATSSLSNEKFSEILASTLNRYCLFSLPEFLIKKIYGKMGEELMLASQDIYPKKALDHGYKFQFSEIEKCLANIFKKN